MWVFLFSGYISPFGQQLVAVLDWSHWYHLNCEIYVFPEAKNLPDWCEEGNICL